MGLAVEVGLLAYLLEEDPEGADGLRVVRIHQLGLG